MVTRAKFPVLELTAEVLNEAAALIKTAYESNPDTNCLDDATLAAIDALIAGAGGAIDADTLEGSDLAAVIAAAVAAATAAISSTPPTLTVITANGTWTKPVGCVRIKVTAIGGGGGGGGASSGNVGQNGGAGGTAVKTIDVTAVTDYPVVIGAGGAGGTVSGTNGSVGGTTTISTLSAPGGAGGAGDASILIAAKESAGGLGTGGDFNFRGNLAMHPYGTGGGGAESGITAGSVGSAGAVIVEEFYQ